MAPELAVLDVTGGDGSLVEQEWLSRAEPVHRQLRDGLPADYAGRLRVVFANGGRMSVATEAQAVRGVAVWRLIENTYEGRRLYVDDLVTDAAHRSRGVGRALFHHLERHARNLQCDVLALDSGTQRTGAHRFYFREGMVIPAFCFRKNLT
ncbi:GNAT family N-acetyltransferase [Sulfuritalea sp.]|uniref:GNAT family N-acetyltransferase n=1 Tax=Sulfuritalea sp. TaxID=2480090 RepID=UPI001AC770D2|nr:GNAT family N-acetyltransferase [Sulfuritalea sp.]MBN8474215.1 GNAT family N-acetyltransferase [Sulfuritalea sp.]